MSAPAHKALACPLQALLLVSRSLVDMKFSQSMAPFRVKPPFPSSAQPLAISAAGQLIWDLAMKIKKP